MKTSNEFLLKKWYLDYITPGFDAAIFYKGSLSYGPIEVHHCSELIKAGGEISGETFWNNKRYSIEHTGDVVTGILNNEILKWKSLCKSITIPIFNKGNKYITWSCLQPLSRVEVPFLHQPNIFGYVEQLETNILPWEFEFEKLIWGRFTSAGTSIVWISLEGTYSKNFVIVNGEEVNAGKITNSEIIFTDGNIQIQDMIVLREGNLLSTLLKNMPFLNQFIPKTGLPLFEKKMLAKGTLTLGDQTEEGQIIHEIVRWK